MKNILILGGSYAGVSTAHRLLKSSKPGTFKITLVSPNSHFYWNMASPRGMIKGQFADEQLFLPIMGGFEQYSSSQFEFILASAETLDVETRSVQISGSAGNTKLECDLLVLATGSRMRGGLPFKGLDSTGATKDALHNLQARAENAKTIIVAGAGVTGLEIAGELGFRYGLEKEITLIASEPTILGDCPASVSKIATQALLDLNVDLKLRMKVISSCEVGESLQELTLADGSKMVTDLYIPTFGLVPNSAYLPADFLDAKGFVRVDEHLRVKGAKNIWALGDVCDSEGCQFITCDKQSVHVSKALASVLNNKVPAPYKTGSSRFMGLQLGKKAGTGHFGSMRIPSFIIVWARKNLFVEKLGPTVDGSLF